MPSNDVKSAPATSEREFPVISRATDVLENELAKPLSPGLYLVSTPIGNLADISLRALAVLARADLIFCEDTRHSRKLFSHFGVSGALHSYHEHNAAKERPRIIAHLRAGQSVALIADAGTPLISDPGHKLVRAARDAGFPVTAVPGASAVLAALTSSGLPTDRFFFEGFLPPKPAARRKRLEALADVPATLVFYEAPSRLEATLTDLREVLGNREGAVAKELTKLHEGFLRGTLDELESGARNTFGEKGEFVVLVGAPAPSKVSDEDIAARLKVAFRTSSFRDGVQEVARMLDVPRKRVYRLALALKDEAGDGGP